MVHVVIPKKPRPKGNRSGASASYSVGVSSETYEKLQRLAQATGQSKRQIVEYLVENAKSA